MKKAIFTILTIAWACILTSAQTMYDSGDKTAKIGIRADWNLTSPFTNLNDIISVYHNGSGFSAGAFYNVPVFMNLYVEPGVSLFYNTIIVAPDEVQAHLMDYKVPPQGSLRNWGVKVPVSIGYKFDFTDNISMSLFTGPQLNIGLSLKQRININDESINLYENGWRKFDAQWTFGMRFYYSDNWMAEITGGIGMTNLLGGDMAKHNHLRRNTFSVGVGYIF